MIFPFRELTPITSNIDTEVKLKQVDVWFQDEIGIGQRGIYPGFGRGKGRGAAEFLDWFMPQFQDSRGIQPG